MNSPNYKRLYFQNYNLCVFKTSNLRMTYNCDQCPGTFALEKYLERHKKRVHQKIRQFKCNICEKSFEDMSKLKRHQVSHNNADETNTFKCKQCDKSYNIIDNLRRHVRITHDKIKNYGCEKCSKTYDSSTELNHHIAVFHNGIKNFKCDYCDKSFGTNGELKKHRESTHEGKKPRKCPYCHMRCYCNNFLKRHIENVHGNKKVSCELCDKSFAKQDLGRHLQTVHEGIKKFKCDLCEKNFARSEDRKSHGKCNNCKKYFDCRKLARKHYEEVHAKPKQDYSELIVKLKPDSLTKELSNPEVLKKDSKLDSNDQDQDLHVPEQDGVSQMYQCVTCKKLFQSAKNLSNHIINFHPVENEN